MRTIGLCSGLGDNRLTGTVPTTISILSELTILCVLPFAVGPSKAGRRWPGPQSAPPRPRRGVLRPFRLLQKNGFVGTIPTTAALIPKLQTVCALIEPSRAVGVRKPPLSFCDSNFGWCRDFSENRMSGAMPSSFTVLLFLQRLCAERHRQRFVRASPARSWVRCRRAFGNYLEGPVPQSLLAMRFSTASSCAGLL
jgi:hypothetical protein